MILCVNANAAIDKTVIVQGFQLNEIHRPQYVSALPGGKGINVARGLKQLGETPVVTGWVGGTAGQFIETGLHAEGIQTRFVHADFESRTCLSILDPQNNTTTEIYELGNIVPAEKIQELRDLFRAEIVNYSAVTFSGSLPPGVPPDFYAELIDAAKRARVPTLLDSSGEALRHGVAAQPTLVKPNKKEFETWLGKKLDTFDACLTAVSETARKSGVTVVLSLGANGLLGARESELVHAVPPPVRFVSAVGSGDCALAGITFGITHSFSFHDILKHGVAAGTANVLTVGAGKFARADFNEVLGKVITLNF